ncbi:heme-binding protein [Sphingomonas sp.]|uniref:GlcG/HbpS family heme-binding protein n=1 Tax=Sphingomonas sp. TaxID=28214 RepID=UPI001ECEAFAD|nr:heme-binding protein [Sphingomonas sp.]MBX3595054.1 heme-binding protein [Sphingomonas sp.]
MAGSVTLDQAVAMIGAALDEAARLKLNPVTVAVLDSGGHLVGLRRQDGSANLRPQIAIGKASGALALGVSSRRIGEMAAERPSFIASVAGLAADGIVPAAGGVVVEDAAGTTIGAIGVTGDTSDNDEACAHAGIAAAGLIARA